MAEAEMAVRNIGTNGIPFLLQWINYEPPLGERNSAVTCLIASLTLRNCTDC